MDVWIVKITFSILDCLDGTPGGPESPDWSRLLHSPNGFPTLSLKSCGSAGSAGSATLVKKWKRRSSNRKAKLVGANWRCKVQTIHSPCICRMSFLSSAFYILYILLHSCLAVLWVQCEVACNICNAFVTENSYRSQQCDRRGLAMLLWMLRLRGLASIPSLANGADFFGPQGLILHRWDVRQCSATILGHNLPQLVLFRSEVICHCWVKGMPWMPNAKLDKSLWRRNLSEECSKWRWVLVGKCPQHKTGNRPGFDRYEIIRTQMRHLTILSCLCKQTSLNSEFRILNRQRLVVAVMHGIGLPFSWEAN